MTRCEELGYKVGDKFVVKNGYSSAYYDEGDVLILTNDDTSDCPEFENINKKDKGGICIYLYKLDKITEEWGVDELPPVGTVCEFVGRQDGRIGTIVCHITPTFGDKLAYIQYSPTGYDFSSSPDKFHRIEPKKTQAQLMEEIFNKSGIQGLIDAGYHK